MTIENTFEKHDKLTKLQVVTLWYIAKIAALSQYQLQLLSKI